MTISSEQTLVWFLRGTALMLVAALAAVVMPHEWMQRIHEWLGMGTLPDLPMFGYLTRSVSAVYACLGAGCWYLSSDVRRYLPLLGFSVPITVIFSVTLVAIDVAVEMPTWWTLIEGGFLLVWTLAIWTLVRRVEKSA